MAKLNGNIEENITETNQHIKRNRNIGKKTKHKTILINHTHNGKQINTNKAETYNRNKELKYNIIQF